MTPKIDRREFLIRTAGALAIGREPGIQPAGENRETTARRSLHILIIGGTGFAGSHQVHAAVARRHKVTVFSRGERKMELPAEVEVLVGDRYRDLSSIANRDWDAVIDFAAFAPLGVRTLGQTLKGRINHYTLISTVAAYERPKADGKLTENSPLLAYEGSEDPYTLTEFRDMREYGALKVLCEMEADKQVPGRTLILRPGYIAGPGEGYGQFAYWTLRMEKGGEVLVAGEPSTPVQYIDVRDLADWCIRMIEKRATGIYNTIGPAVPTNLGQFIDSARAATSTSSKMIWVPASWLAAREDRDVWGKLLFWSLEADNWGWAMQMNIDRALAMGLTFRPMNTTRTDTAAWFRKQPTERQAEILSIWKKNEDGVGFGVQTIPWPLYLEREKEIVAAWHAQHRNEEANDHDEFAVP